MNTPVIALRNLTRIYPLHDASFTALAIEDLTIQIHEWVSIVGPSGSGKTTLLHILGLLDRATTGSYFLQGKDTTQLSATQQALMRNQTIGFIFQRFHLLPMLTVAENIALPLHYGNHGARAIQRRVYEMLEVVGLTAHANKYPHQLSGGQQQRIAIARALAPQPTLILADEPTGSLDSKTGELLLDFLQELHKNTPHLTLVLITHDASVAAKGTRTIHMRDGRITQDFRK